MVSKDVDARIVKQALRAMRYGDSLGQCALVRLDAVRSRLRSQGLPDTPETRAAELFILLDELIWRELSQRRGADGRSCERDEALAAGREQISRDFQSGDAQLEAWSALHYRYIVDLGMREAEIADLVGISYRTLARRLDRGHAALAQVLRETEIEATAALLAQPGRLPAALTSFVGRDVEIGQIDAVVASRRLVSLTGPGGIGKTRLAVAAAGALGHRFADGVTFVDLARLREPALVPTAVAGALGVQAQMNQPVLDAVTRFLRDRHALLLLDNCEHLLDPCARLCHDLLSDCPRLHVMSTSRQRLGVPGESVFTVQPLDVPDNGAHGDVPVALRYPAIQLFHDRAVAASLDFAITDGNCDVVVELCRRLEGIPLAIELAAARVGALAPIEMLERLDERFALLTEGPRTVRARQQTLRATLDWSYALLDLHERTLWHRLSVFRGGFTLSAAEAVCSMSPIDPSRVLDLLANLVSKSLVTVEGRDEGHRYDLLETVRDYTRELLGASHESAAVEARHAGHYLDLAERAMPELKRADSVLWLRRLDAEHDNLRAASSWFYQQGDAESGLRLAGALLRYLMPSGHAAEGRAQISRFLALPEADVSGPVRARALRTYGGLASWQGDPDAARAYLEESMDLFRTAGDRAGIAGCMNNLGNIAMTAGDEAVGRSMHEESLRLRREIGDTWGVCQSLINLAWIAQHLDSDYAAARAALDEGDALDASNGRVLGAWLAMCQSDLELDVGDFRSARSMAKRALRLVPATQQRQLLPRIHLFLGAASAEQGDFPAARRHFEEGLALRLEMGEGEVEAHTDGLIRVALHTGAIDEAREMLGGAGAPELKAQVLLHEGDLDLARYLLDQRLSDARDGGAPRAVADAALDLGNVAYLQGDVSVARSSFEESHALMTRIGARAGTADARHGLGLVALATGSLDEARSHLIDSLKLQHYMGRKPALVASYEGLARLMVRLADPDRALALAGVAAGQREAIGAVCPPVALRMLERDLEAARAAITTDAADEAFAAGRAMVREAAFELATDLRGRDRSGAPAAAPGTAPERDGLTPT